MLKSYGMINVDNVWIKRALFLDGMHNYLKKSKKPPTACS
jgi:hypothetical protein